MRQEKTPTIKEIPIPEEPTNTSRREFLKTAGILGALVAGKPEEAAALLEDVLKKEGAEKTEKIKVNFRFFNAMHRTREDVRGLAEEIKKADVFIPEGVGWNSETLSGYQALSKGAITPLELMEKYGIDKEESRMHPRSEEFEALADSKKLILFADLPAGHPVYEKYREMRISPRQKIKTFAEALESAKSSIKNFAEALLLREKHIISEILKIRENIEHGRYPELKGKKSVTVLIFLGAVHTLVYHKLKETAENTSRTFPVMPFQYANPPIEMVRRYLFGKEVDDELAARAFLSGHVNSLPHWTQLKDTHKVNRYMRAIVEQFSYKEVEAFFSDLQNTDISTDSVILKLLRAKNIKIPNSDAELDELLKNTKS